MTKPKPHRPEPTPDTGYESYLVPRSKNPGKQRVYDDLLARGWRYCSPHSDWHPPLEARSDAFGRLEYAPDFSWYRVQSPSTMIDGDLVRGPALLEVTMEPA